MKVILFGTTGMVGQGVLRECLADPRVISVLSLVRSSSGIQHEKLKELIHQDFFNFAPLANELKGYDACFFCLGVSSAGMNEENYRHMTYDLTLAAAQTLAPLNPGMTFIYVSGQGTDSTERGRVMWARVKGATENALLRLPFKAVYLFRPGFIEPLDGIEPKVKLYRAIYAVLAPLMPLLRPLFGKHMTNTRQMGRAMIVCAAQGAPQKFLENPDINQLK